MQTLAVILEKPGHLIVAPLALDTCGEDDVVVDIAWSGISTGTERLLWTGRMPAFPGLGYPLVPGYESVGRVVQAGAGAQQRVGEQVFVPGARCYGAVRGLFGGAAGRVVVPGHRVVATEERLGERAVLLALAATAHHALAALHARLPELIVGHGVLGRLLARLTVAKGGQPVVWETQAARAGGAERYKVIHPDQDQRRDYTSIYDVSGDASLTDGLIGRAARGAEIVLAGFYEERIGFAFPPAFMREIKLRIAAEWQPSDLTAVAALIEAGQLSLDDLITHRSGARDAASAYETAFNDPTCLKMVLDWRGMA
jgi:bacteriochlorophyllide a dehydrogenase